MSADLNYYRRRQAEEAAAAHAAPDPNVGAVHLELARRYGERLMSLEPTQPTQFESAA